MRVPSDEAGLWPDLVQSFTNMLIIACKTYSLFHTTTNIPSNSTQFSGYKGFHSILRANLGSALFQVKFIQGVFAVGLAISDTLNVLRKF